MNRLTPSSYPRLYHWFYILTALTLITPVVLWGIAHIWVMNLVQLPLTDTEIVARAESLWLYPQFRTIDIDGRMCTPARHMFIPQAYATVNNELFEMEFETPYGYNDSSSHSYYSACLKVSLSTNDISLVRVVMYEALNPFDFTLYEWTVKAATMALSPLRKEASLVAGSPTIPMSYEAATKRANELWETSEPEDKIFKRPWIQPSTDSNPEMICFSVIGDYLPGIDVRIDGYKIEDVVRYPLRGLAQEENSISSLWETSCFARPDGGYIRLIQVTVQNSPTVFRTHQWAVKIIYTSEKKTCLAYSQSSSKCF